MTVITPLLAAALLVLPPVTPPVADDNFGGTYERDGNGIIQAHAPDLSECETDEDRRYATAITLVANQQYTILHDNFGAEAAESTNYGWVGGDDNTTSKIRALNGYSTIQTKHGDDFVATRHFVVIIDDDGKESPETDYLPGNAALAPAA